MLVFESANAKLYHGNSLDILKDFPDNSIDSIVTDPPYGLSNTTPELVAATIGKWISGERDFIPDGKGFMGKEWDAFVPPPAIWDECLRVLKPGGHMLAFFGSRTQDIGALSIRLAGFEIRDTLQWIYGSGFPKSLDIGKAIDKALGVEREITGYTIAGIAPGSGNAVGGPKPLIEKKENPITKEAKQWEGWGTALKPAYEPIILARKPLNGTVAQTILQYGTGGINIDGSRIGTEKRKNNINDFSNQHGNQFGNGQKIEKLGESEVIGRWPSNLILDEEAARLLDEQSGISKSQGGRIGKKETSNIDFGLSGKYEKGDPGYGDTGGASRFFYTSKASRRDRNEGLEGLPQKQATGGGGGIGDYLDDVNSASGKYGSEKAPAANHHATVKPTDLMQYLVNLITPPNGTVLDPFTGSGSTGKAAILKGFNFIGVEITDEYLPIIQGRLAHAQEQRDKTEGETLF